MGQFDADVVDFAAEQAKRQPAPAASPVMGGTMAPAARVPATVQPGPFDEAVAEYGQSQHQAATGNIIAGHGSNPDAAGKALTLAPHVGVPPGVVDTDLAGFEAQHRIAQNSKIAGGNPRMADWLGGDPMRARVSMDDFEHLDTLSKITTAWGNGWGGALLGNERGRLGAEAALGAQNEAQVAKVERDLAAHPQLGGIWGKLQTVAGFAGGMTDNFLRGSWTALQGASIGMVAGGAAGAPAGGVGVVPGAIGGSATGAALGFGIGWKYDAAKIAGGNTYLDLSETVGQNGKKIDPVAKDAASLLVALGTYAFLKVGEGNVAKPAGEAASKFLADAVKESVTRPTVQMALKKFGTEMAKAGVTGAALNMAMEGTSIFGEEFGKQLSGGKDFETLFNNPAQRQQAVDHLITAATDGAMLFPLVHGVIGTPGLVMDSLRARQSKADVATFQALETGAAANKTRERSLGAFQTFMEHQTGGTPVENLSIAGEAVRTLYQSKGIEPGPGDGLLGDVVPGLKEQLEQSAATGGDIVVPTAAYVAHLAGTPVSEALRADIRFRPDGMTMKEAAQYEAERGAHLADLATQGQASLDAAAVAADPGRQVFADIFGKLRAAGQSHDAATQYATLVASRYEARAERLSEGADPFDWRATSDAIEQEYHGLSEADKKSDIGQAMWTAGGPAGVLGWHQSGGGPKIIKGVEAIEAARAHGREDIVDTIVQRAKSAADSAKAAKPGVPKDSPKYKKIEDDLARIAGETEEFAQKVYEAAGRGPKREKRTALDLYRAEGLDVRRETPESLRHVATDESDLVINALRNDNRKAPKPRELFGPSLHEAVKEAGGIVDSGGELKAMDLDKAKTRGLIRKATGDATDDIHHSMDAMALRMWEMGYFPDKVERPTEQDLIDAMRNGDAHYAEGVGNERKAAFEEAVRDLDEFLNRQGIDVKKASNAEIKAAIDKHIADEQALAGRTLAQGERGSITLEDGRAIITLFKDADLTTFVHEIGHKWLEEMLSDALQLDAPESLKADTASLKKWLGMADDQHVPTTEQHEEFARGTEKFFLEGRAPSAALASTMRKLKAWFLRIYKSAITLRVPMNDEIRGVFDRMVASDDAIKNWREAESLRPVFADAKSAGMTDAEFTAYSKAIDKAANSADEKMLRKSMEAVRKARTKEWKEEASSVRAEVEPEVRARPDLRAQYFLRTGKNLADPEAPAVEPVKLSREALDDMYGTDEASKALPSGIISAKEGVHPDEVADLFGYRSGDEMVRALMSLEASRKQAEEATGEKLDGNKYVRKLVDDRVQETMLERHGDALNDGSIEAEALAAVHNAAQADVMSMEAKAIARQAGVTALRKEDISRWADAQLDDMPADRATDVRSFARQEAKAGREVQRALLKGDAAAAFEAKQRQLINHILATKSAEALEQHTKDVSLLRKLGRTPRRETVQQSFMDQIHSITERLGIQTKRTEADAAATPSLNKFVSDQAAIGQDVFMPEVLLNERFTGNVDTMKLGDFFDAMEGVQSLLNLGRAMRKMEVDGEQIHFAEIVDDMRTQVGDVAATEVGMQARATSLDKIKVDALGIVAALKRVENWALLMDKGNRQGPFTRYIVKPVFEATEKYRPEKQRRLQQLWDILEPRRKELNQGKIFSPELNYTFVNKGELLHAIGHTGNESNMTKLLVGRGWGELDADGKLDRSRWDSAMDRLHSDGTVKQADYDTVQKIWDLLEEIKPAAQDAHKSIYGVRFDEVTAAPVQTPWGEYRGGYMPAIVDRFIVDDGKLRDDVDALKQQQTGGMFPSTGRGFTKSRVANYNKALELNLSLIPSHIDSVLRFTHLQPTIREVGRLMLKPGFRDMMRGADPAAVSSMLVPWLQRTARQTVTTPALDPAGRAADKVFNALRRRSGVQILAFNVSNTLQQFVGIAPGVLKSSPGAMMRSLYTFMRQPKTMADEIAAASPFMDERMRGKSFDLQVSIEKALTSTNKFTDFRYWSQENAHVFQHLAQNMVDIVTWRAAFDHETAKGTPNADAIHAANAAVRETQGGFNPEEVSRFETGGALGRLFTHMYSYFGSQANLIGTEVALTKDMGFKKGAARNAMIYTFGLMIPAVISDAIYRTISGSGQQDTEDGSPWDMETLASQFLGSQAKYMAGMVPIAGPVVVAAFDSNAGDRIGSSPTASSVKQAAKAPGEIYDSLVEGKAPSRGIRDGLTALGLATGLPLGQAGRPLGYAADVATGHQTPTSAADVARGLMTGKQGEGAIQ